MFFEPSSFGARKLSMDHFREWAGGIAAQYLQGGILPTDALCKTAQAEDLTPDLINVLAAEINKEIHRQKFAGMDEKYFAADFPLADAAIAIRRLQADGGTQKVATAMPEPVIRRADADPFEAFGVKPEVQDKTASVKHELRHVTEKAELLEQRLQDKIAVLKYQHESTARSFIKQAKDYVLSYSMNQAERIKMLDRVHDFAKAAGMGFAAPLLKEVASSLGGDGLLTRDQVKTASARFEKAADMKAPESLISPTLPAQIVNGNHPLYITLKTFHDQHSALNLNEDRLKLVQDKLRVLRQKVRAL